MEDHLEVDQVTLVDLVVVHQEEDHLLEVVQQVIEHILVRHLKHKVVLKLLLM